MSKPKQIADELNQPKKDVPHVDERFYSEWPPEVQIPIDNMELPWEFKEYLKDPSKAPGYEWDKHSKFEPKDVWVLVPETGVSNRCRNCMGAGSVYVFIVMGGPYDVPPNGKGVVAKWRGNGWYSGHIIASACPSCNEYEQAWQATMQQESEGYAV
jgi:hypothetical protein